MSEGTTKNIDLIRQNLDRIKARMESACRRSGRSLQSVTLVAVSKGQSVDHIQAAYQLGVRDFGENYVQELQEKRNLLPQDIRWHFIGPLQSNKIRMMGRVHLFHAADRVKILSELNRSNQNSHPLDVLLQVNLSGEESKHGFNPATLESEWSELSSLTGIRIRGLMTLPPPSLRPDDNREFFRQLAKLAKSWGASFLSMGMSDDFEIAIEEGATHIRIGTLLFGPRNQRQA